MSRRVKKAFVLLLFIPCIIYSCALIPLYSIVSNNAIYADTVLPEVILTAYQLVELFIYVVAAAFLTYSVVRFKLAGSKQLIFTYLGAILFKYISLFIVKSILSGVFDPFGLRYTGLYILIDLFQLGVFLLILRSISIGCSTALESGRSCFPFKRLFNFGNPMQRGAFFGALIILLMRLGSRLIYDISYGAPSSLPEALLMFGYYSLDVFTGVAAYFAMIWMLMTIDQKNSITE